MTGPTRRGETGRQTVAVFGATGRTGRLVTDEAVSRGDSVHALVRDPARAPAQWHSDPHVTIITGDALDPQAVRSTISGASAVAVVLGHAKGSPPNVLELSMRHILAAMPTLDVRRIVYLTGAGVGHESDRPRLVDRVFGALVRVVARDLYRDSVASTALLRGSDLDWTVCRATRLIDGDPGDALYVGPLGPASGVRVTRADVARWIVDELHAGRHVHDAPVLTRRR